MPEGVEVRLTAEEVSKYICNNQLVSIEILSGRYKRHGNPQGFGEISSQLPLTINKVCNKGKGIFFHFDKDWFMYNTLGMTGQWTTTFQKHCNVKFVVQEPFPSLETFTIYFRDIRNFGTLKFIQGKDKLELLENRLGPDMMDESTDFNVFTNRVRKYNHKNITQVLMTQSVVSGIGNYIKAEALYRAKISPHRLVKEISDESLLLLFHSVKDIMNESYQLQGNTFNTYRNFQSGGGNFSSMLRVYRQDVDSNGYEVVKEKTLDGRTTHWVKEIQL